jgi:serine phosphatase RsbU (regulator of sigma subunit)
MLRAIRRQHMDAWIVAIGIFLFDVTLVKEFINDFIFEFPANLLTASDAVGTWGLALLITIYLARQFAYTSTNLDAQLVKEVEHEREKTRFALVEAENERRAKELEEARQLQLSMLPKKLPQIEGLEIAAYMKPATEVGGDYYDFHVGTDGTLTVAVGDATGHGLKAGTVVTATKSLFANLAHQPSISEIFKQTSAALKSMNLRGLFMAMTMLKIKDDVMTVSIAGMPSALVYRNDSKSVEEIAIRAMPLGSIAKTNYQGQQITLSSADVVVVMSDGFPEMFNPANDMLGFEKAAEVLPNIADLSAQEIISEFVKIGEEWANGRAQDDDVTFVVLKIGSDGK